MQRKYKEEFKALSNETLEIRTEKELKFKKLFSKKLSLYLTSNNIQVKKLSEMTGYTIQHCSNIKKGDDSTKAPSLFCLYRLCTELNVSPEYLWDFDTSFSSPDKGEILTLKKEQLMNKIKFITDERLLDKLFLEIEYNASYQNNIEETEHQY